MYAIFDNTTGEPVGLAQTAALANHGASIARDLSGRGYKVAPVSVSDAAQMMACNTWQPMPAPELA